MIAPQVELRHHFSYKTGVSVLLPADWQEVANEGVAAFYVNTSDDPHAPNIGINIFQLNRPDPSNYLAVAKDIADTTLPGFTDLGVTQLSVDGYPAALHIYAWRDPESGDDVLQQYAIVQVEAYMWTILGTSRRQLAETFQPFFADVLQSIRFISTAYRHQDNEVAPR